MEPTMTSRASAPSLHKGFTLTEMIVVMAVIVLLATILLPMLLKVYGRGKKTRASADLQAIAVGLDAYRADFGDYPRFPMAYVAGNTDTAKDRGARLLCRALLAPGPEAGAGTSGFDGAAGPGFRLRPGGLSKVWGPYINAEKFKTTTPLDETAKLLDSDGKVILYFPAKTGNVNIGPPAANQGFVASRDPTTPIPPATAVAPLYNSWDNETYLALASMRRILGDANGDGVIDPATNEKAATQQPYLLWTPGSDGNYGIDTKLVTDDVVNFDIPSDLVKN
jgi:prepilin-type N-terminal cleavage/methylation domain-containing protein